VTEGWSEAEAEERWLEEMEAGETAAALVAERLAGPEVGSDPRERAYREAAGRWLARGRPQVALALLDRSTSGPSAVPSLAGDGRADVPVELLLARLPGVGGLPALTEAEADSLRAATGPEEALAVIRSARRRLAEHGEEARRLLGRWLERQG
jgi:hypothetical protein